MGDRHLERGRKSFMERVYYFRWKIQHFSSDWYRQNATYSAPKCTVSTETVAFFERGLVPLQTYSRCDGYPLPIFYSSPGDKPFGSVLGTARTVTATNIC